MKNKTFYIPRSDSTIESVTGKISKDGALIYESSFGRRVCDKEYFFISIDDAANELISDIDNKIKKLMETRIEIIRNYK